MNCVSLFILTLMLSVHSYSSFSAGTRQIKLTDFKKSVVIVNIVAASSTEGNLAATVYFKHADQLEEEAIIVAGLCQGVGQQSQLALLIEAKKSAKNLKFTAFDPKAGQNGYCIRDLQVAF